MQHTAEVCGALAHARQPESARAGGRRIKANPVVDNFQPGRLRGDLEPYSNSARMRMLHHVVQRFLRKPIQFVFRFGRQAFSRLAGKVNFKTSAGFYRTQ
jgi:hypothetical protein